MKQGNKDLPYFDSTGQRVRVSSYSGFTKQSVRALLYSDFTKQSVRALLYSDFTKQSARALLYSDFTKQSVRASLYAISTDQSEICQCQRFTLKSVTSLKRLGAPVKGSSQAICASRPRDFQGCTTRTEQGIGLLTIPVLVAGRPIWTSQICAIN